LKLSAFPFTGKQATSVAIQWDHLAMLGHWGSNMALGQRRLRRLAKRLKCCRLYSKLEMDISKKLLAANFVGA